MLGELGVMAEQTTAMSHQIFERAQEQLSKLESGLDAARVQALAGNDEDKDRYQQLIEERGRLQHVIATAREELATEAYEKT